MPPPPPPAASLQQQSQLMHHQQQPQPQQQLVFDHVNPIMIYPNANNIIQSTTPNMIPLHNQQPQPQPQIQSHLSNHMLMAANDNNLTQQQLQTQQAFHNAAMNGIQNPSFPLNTQQKNLNQTQYQWSNNNNAPNIMNNLQQVQASFQNQNNSNSNLNSNNTQIHNGLTTTGQNALYTAYHHQQQMQPQFLYHHNNQQQTNPVVTPSLPSPSSNLNATAATTTIQQLQQIQLQQQLHQQLQQQQEEQQQPQHSNNYNIIDNNSGSNNNINNDKKNNSEEKQPNNDDNNDNDETITTEQQQEKRRQLFNLISRDTSTDSDTINSNSASVNGSSSTKYFTTLKGSFAGGWQSNNDLSDRRNVIILIAKLINKMQPAGDDHRKLPAVAKKLEECLYRMAKTKEEYMNPDTLKKRLQIIAFSLVPNMKKSSSNGNNNQNKEIFTTQPDSQKGGVSVEAQERIKQLRKQNQLLEQSMGITSGPLQENQPSQSVDPNSKPLKENTELNKSYHPSIAELENNLMRAKAAVNKESESINEKFQDEDLSQEQKRIAIRQQQQRLILLRHASKCNVGEACKTKHCAQMVQLWNHMKSCRDKNCRTSHCISSRCVLNHYRICKDSMQTANCAVCGPVMELMRYQDTAESKNPQNSKGNNDKNSESILDQTVTTSNAGSDNVVFSTNEMLAKKQKLNEKEIFHELRQQQIQAQVQNQQRYNKKSQEQNQNTGDKIEALSRFDLFNKELQQNYLQSQTQNKLDDLKEDDYHLEFAASMKVSESSVFDSLTSGVQNSMHEFSKKRDFDELNEVSNNEYMMFRTESNGSLVDVLDVNNHNDDDFDKDVFSLPISTEGITTYGNTKSRNMSPEEIEGLILPLVNQLLGDPLGWLFEKPVDPVELGIPDYFDIIKEPMDLSLVKKRLKEGYYKTIEEVERDVNLVFENAINYNGEDSDVGQKAIELLKLFNDSSNKNRKQSRAT